jgi:putative hydrolase of the HAD superfamily
MIKVVTFDLDGVYFTPQSFKNFKAKLPKTVTNEEKINWVLYKSSEMMNFKTGKMGENDYWNYARRELGIKLDDSEIFNILRDSYEINPEVKDFISEIKSKGLKTCICSNNFVTRIRELDSEFNFLKDFDIKIFSFEVGIMKPDKRIFETLIKQSEVEPKEIVYADDDVSKLQGAIELGINAFVYEDFRSFKNKINFLMQ